MHIYTISNEGETENQTKSISQVKLVKKEPGAGKREMDVRKKQSGTRRQNTKKTGLKAEAADNNRRPKTCRKSSLTGDRRQFICHVSVCSQQDHHL